MNDIRSEAGCQAAPANETVSALLGLPAQDGYCVGSRPVRLEHRKQPERESVTRFSCASWRCQICCARLRLELGLHLGRKLLQARGHLFTQASEPERWESDRKALSRRADSWARIAWPDHVGLIVGVQHCEIGEALADGREAVRHVGKALLAIRHDLPVTRARVRPVSTSRDWTPPVQPPAYKREGWVTVTDPQPVLDCLGKLGIETRSVQQGRSRWTVYYEVPEHLKAQVQAALSQISSIQPNANAAYLGQVGPPAL
jgi:hypothetical protein